VNGRWVSRLLCAQPSRWARAHERVRRSLSRSRAPGRWGTKLYSSTLAPLVQCRSSARLTLDTCTGTMRDPGEAWGTRSGWSTSSDVALSSISVGSPHAHTHVPMYPHSVRTRKPTRSMKIHALAFSLHYLLLNCGAFPQFCANCGHASARTMRRRQTSGRGRSTATTVAPIARSCFVGPANGAVSIGQRRPASGQHRLAQASAGSAWVATVAPTGRSSGRPCKMPGLRFCGRRSIRCR